MSARSRRSPLSPRVALVVVALAALAPAAGCSSGDDDGASVSGERDVVTSTTVAPTDAAADVAEPEVVMVRSYASPMDAGTELFAVWRTGDAAAAAGMGPPEAIFELFTIGAEPGAKNRGCDDGEFGSASCFFSNGQGGVNIALTPGPDGWQVATIDAF